MKYRTLYFYENKLRILDQTQLPGRIEYIACNTVRDVYDAIREMKVRGAPAIGIAGAYGMVLALETMVKPNGEAPKNWDEVYTEILAAAGLLISARPTAINLKWAVERMLNRARDEIKHSPFEPDKLKTWLAVEAHRLSEEDARSCTMIGKYGASLIRHGMGVLTYCNAGGLATLGIGTALAPIYEAFRASQFNVYCCETRPHFQGARLTAWELRDAGLNPTLICDNTAAALMARKMINVVIVGADRIAANGDVANKIGTYNLAIAAKYHDIPFYVAAPASTFDLNLTCGEAIPIETRDSVEITHINGKNIAPECCNVYTPIFDVTPRELITAIITDRGLIAPVNDAEIERWLAF